MAAAACVLCRYPHCRERSACDKAEAALEGVKEELAAMHEAMASLHGEMGAMQREVRSTRFDWAEAKRSDCDRGWRVVGLRLCVAGLEPGAGVWLQGGRGQGRQGGQGGHGGT